MHSKFRKFFLIGLLAAVASGCGDDNNDDDQGTGNQVNTPAEVPTPTPSAFKWASVRFDHRDDAIMFPLPGSCNGFTRFQVTASGSFRAHDPCVAGPDKKGNLTANELGALDALMNGVSREEASTKLKCTQYNDELMRADQRLSMTSNMKSRYALYTQNDDQECVSGNPAEISAIRNSLYELQAKYQ